uniref:O-methyltransferase C-terminal domain-containing protein n=1 Tax=Ananas comosus var. bracteatus TaxID=296719 RepID=A0A6V7PUP8_ANACO|nr:unnamed protein product [Ananas comosus var. bracteatus]
MEPPVRLPQIHVAQVRRRARHTRRHPPPRRPHLRPRPRHRARPPSRQTSAAPPPHAHARFLPPLHEADVRSRRRRGGGGFVRPHADVRLLVDDAGGRRSLAPFVRSMFDPVLMAPSLRLGDWFKEADGIATPFEALHGSNIWGVTSRNPEFNAAFNEGMAADGRFIMDVVVRKCGHVFRGLRSLVDVGGGTGAAARAIAEAFPDVKCAVLDLPQVVQELPADGPVEFIAGSMFERVPPADAVMLKWVLHDWDDEDCVRILRRCKEAIPPREPGGKVIVMEPVIGSSPEEKSTGAQLFIDMWMMIQAGGRERDELEWRKIFTKAGFSDYKIVATLGFRSVIEVYP